jgi:hypothetical protein
MRLQGGQSGVDAGDGVGVKRDVDIEQKKVARRWWPGSMGTPGDVEIAEPRNRVEVAQADLKA